MIEPFHILSALRKRWRLVAVSAVLFAVVAVIIPVSSPKPDKTLLKWETWAVVGAPAPNGLIAGTVSTSQILFFANTYSVKLSAVIAVGLRGDPYAYAAGMFTSSVSPAATGHYPTAGSASETPVTKKGASGNVTLYAAAPTRELAAALVNAYSHQVDVTLTALAVSHAAATAPANKSGAATPTPSTGYQVIFPGTTLLAHRTSVRHSSPLDSHKTRLILGLIVGGLVALLIILALEVLNKSIRRRSRAEHHFKFPVIAEILETYPSDFDVVDMVDRPTSPASEGYRKLRMSVLFEAMASDAAATGPGGDAFGDLFGLGSAPVEPYRVPELGSRNVLLITSTLDEPARAKVVANLAVTYAEAGERVLLVNSGDLEIGAASSVEGVQNSPVTSVDIERLMSPSGAANVSMLSMRHFMRNSGQLVTRSKEVLDAARQVAAVVIIEVPAFLRFHHGEALVHSVDAVIVVAENGVTKAQDARDMGDILRRLGAPVLGVVFAGGELSRNQKRKIDKGFANSERADIGHAADVQADTDVANADAVSSAGAAAAAPELHPS
jgi:Mrp family chromosome partitioning ATPase